MNYKKSFSVVFLVVMFSLVFTMSVLAQTNVDRILQVAPSQRDYPQAEAVIIKEEIIADHTTSQDKIRRRLVVKVFNKRGIKRFGELKIRFNKSNEEIKIVEAKTIEPSGKVIKPQEDGINIITPAGASQNSIYSDARIKVISMPGVKQGSIIVLEYLKKIESYPIKGQFWHREIFQDIVPIKEKKFVVKLPEDKELNYRVEAMELEPQIKQQQQKKIYTWYRKDIPAIIKEPNMPPLIDIAPRVELSTLDSWSQVSMWYKGLINNQYKLNAKIKNKVKDLTKLASSKEEKIRAIYNYVTSNIRYIGLEFGINGYKPHKAIVTYQNKYGDCKDKATLLIAMLKEIGVKGQPVLINRRSDPKLKIVSPALFNHMIVYLPARDQYLDPTSSGTRYGYLLGDQGKEVLLPMVNKITETPIMSARANQMSIKQQVKLNKDGSAIINYQEGYTGIYDYKYKNIFRRYSPQQRKILIKRGISQGFPGAKHVQPKLEGVINLDKHFMVTISDMKVSNYAKQMGNLFALQPIRYPINLNGLAAAKKRKYPLYLGYKIDVKRRIEIKLPSDFKVSYLPSRFKFENRIGKVLIDYQVAKKEIIVKFNLVINQIQIRPEDYQSAKKLLNKASLVVQNQILVQKNK